MLLDTSFNVKGQPIVNTPEEAVETCLRTVGGARGSCGTVNRLARSRNA
jgi:hypothetical protein